MSILKHELKQGSRSFIIWTASISFFLIICILMFPEIKGEMEGISEMFASMGSFSAAFGMDRLNFGTLKGFYSVECGNILGMGGAFFASLIAVTALAKEEKEHTAEFLFSHPISRFRVVSEKLLAVMLRIVTMNVIIWALSAAAIVVIGEKIPFKEILLLHIAYTLLQIELAGICFCLSAFLQRGSIGIGLGIAAALYFLNIVANINERADFLKYITPFGYTEGADIIENGSLDFILILIGMAYAVIGIAIAYIKYSKKDLR
ncbi:MAG: ABC transporter permease subunit [Acutalibacteraceae bacterium]|jgi:ABC-2 type transport system permease protein